MVIMAVYHAGVRTFATGNERCLMRPAAEWDEDYVLSLPAENDRFERKGIRSLDLTAGADEGKVRDELAKQLSAFANSGGGIVIYGLTDTGTVDSGGINRILRGRQSTKDWLENVIPLLTEFEIVGVNVYEIRPKTETSQIHKEKSLYLVDIPASERAPHQSTRDHLYYIRLGGKSEPAPHQLVEDIRNRAKHPNIELVLELGECSFLGPQVPPSDCSVDTPITVRLRNVGGIRSQNTCFYLQLNLASGSIRTFDELTLKFRRTEQDSDRFWEVLGPIYPGMDLSSTIRLKIRLAFKSGQDVLPFWSADLHNDLSKVQYKWTLFADDAPMKTGEGTLGMLGFDSRMRDTIQRHPRVHEIIEMCGRLP
jgi:hypothetical protein